MSNHKFGFSIKTARLINDFGTAVLFELEDGQKYFVPELTDQQRANLTAMGQYDTELLLFFVKNTAEPEEEKYIAIGRPIHPSNGE